MTTIEIYSILLHEEELLITHKKGLYKTIMDTIGNVCYDIIKHCNVGYDDFQDFGQLDELIDMVYITVIPFFTEEEKEKEDFEMSLRLCITKELMRRTPEKQPRITNEELVEINKQIEVLKGKPQPEQRSEEWYAFRKQRLTASDFATALNKNPYSDRKALLRKKAGENQPFHSGAAIFHGVKYEDVAISVYEERNRVLVKEYGCIPHPTLSFIGASPDGICDTISENKQYVGRMLEIKCPRSRELNGTVPEYYYYQVQGQLEVCELEYCDFLQCIIREFPEDDFWSDVGKRNNHSYCKNGNEKGVLIEYYDTKKEKDSFYYYPRSTQSTKNNINMWINETIDKILDEDNEFCSVKYWKMCEYDCILVKRDRKLWKWMEEELGKFWNEVLHYQKVGYESLKPQKKIKANKTEYWEKEVNSMAFQPETDEEEI